MVGYGRRTRPDGPSPLPGSPVCVRARLHASSEVLANGGFSILLIAVIASSWVGGLGPGLFATLLSVLATDFFILAPTYSLVVHSADDIARVAVFSRVALVINFLQRAQKKAQKALGDLNEKLEERVEAHTS